MVKRVSFFYFVLISSMIGFLIPFLWIFFWRISIKWFPAVIEALMSTTWVNDVLLLFWPSSIFMLGDPSESNYELLAFSILLNVGFYFFLGALFWNGIYRNRLYIVPAVGLFVSVWIYMVNI